MPEGADDRVQRLLDIEEIKQLKARYFRHMDSKEWQKMRALFTDDARFEGTSQPWQNPDEFIAGVSGNLERMSTVHHGHMPEIVITGPDTARGIWAMFDRVDWSRSPEALGHPRSGEREAHGIAGYGHYQEEYRKVDGAWRISFLRLTRIRVDDLTGEPLQTRQDLLRIDRGWLG